MAISQRKTIIFASILLISLVLNLFFAGLVTGMFWHQFSTKSEPRGAPPDNPFKILRAIPEAREQIRPILQRHFPQVRPKMEQLQQARRQIRHQLTQKSLDKAALRQAFVELHQAQQELKASTHDVLLEIISQLTFEQRQRLVQHRKHDRHPPPPFGDHPPPRKRFLWSRDQNHDGQISQEEFLQDTPEFRQQEALRRFKHLDRDQDGFINENEMRPPPPPPHPDDF